MKKITTFRHNLEKNCNLIEISLWYKNIFVKNNSLLYHDIYESRTRNGFYRRQWYRSAKGLLYLAKTKGKLIWKCIEYFYSCDEFSILLWFMILLFAVWNRTYSCIYFSLITNCMVFFDAIFVSINWNFLNVNVT